ncbi:unnamed protein product [Symbiodinium natans]|uniref:Uncharacterized protein n=1 Tax=Symbiodinium natans TaxID=878477 RepID=A0A812JA18_9DINO|nr:unnamed protein product [Symbiodinium natans]
MGALLSAPGAEGREGREGEEGEEGGEGQSCRSEGDLGGPEAEPRNLEVLEIQLEVRSLAGEQIKLPVTTTTTCADLASAIESQLGLSAELQDWVLDFAESAEEGAPRSAPRKLRPTSAEAFLSEALTSLTSPSPSSPSSLSSLSSLSLTVLHLGFTPLAALPPRFALRLTSTRTRAGEAYRRMSSAFASLCYLRGDVDAHQLVVEPWRKNDHDQYIYDIKAHTVKATTSHWMSGSTEKTEALAHDPLAELVQNWCAARCRRPDADQRFWRLETETAVEPTECEPPCRVRKTRAEPGRPNYAAVPGWFVAPADCTELVCEAAVGPVKILRLLVNQDGKPIRAALCCKQVSPLHAPRVVGRCAPVSKLVVELQLLHWRQSQRTRWA